MRVIFPSTLFLLLFLCLSVSAQWDPNAGVVKSYCQGATVATTSGTSGANAIDDNENTAWQGIGVLPSGFIPRPELNILLGTGVQAQNSGGAIATKTTDGDLNTFTQIVLSGGKSWIRYNLPSPVQLRHVSIKCNSAAVVNVYAHHPNGDSTFLGSVTPPADNFQLKRFSPMLNNVSKIKLLSTSRISIFEIAALSKIPTEYLTVDLGQLKRVGYIETRHWADGGAVATKIYVSTNNVNWTYVGDVYPDALKLSVTRPATPVMARYVKVEHSMVEQDYMGAYVWEIRVYDENGPFGPFQAPKPHNSSVKKILGVNGIWGWGHNMFAGSIPAGQGPTRFNQIASHARSYHNMHWDVDDPDIIPPYSTMHIIPNQMATWWLDWNREYLAWKTAGLKVQASIQFNEWIPQTRMVNWDNPYTAAYNYGYAFSRHFGPTYGNGLVDVIEVGNEPWTYPAAFYLDILRGMLHGIKDADPAMKALPCALQSAFPDTENPVGGNWMGARLTQSEANLIDGINIHHYSYTYDSIGTRIAVHPEHPESAMHAAVNDIRFRDKNLPGKKIYLSEWGWDSDGGGETCTFGECVTEYEQAIYGVRGAMMFMRLGIDRLTWYFYGNQGSGNLYSRSGMEASSTTNFAEKKSMKSFRSFVHLMGDAYFLDTLREDNTGWIYLFGDSIGNPTHIAAWRPVDGSDPSFVPLNLTTVLRPDSAWTITGNSNTGEVAVVPAYNNGVMQLQLSAAPLILKVTPTPSTNYIWTGNISGDWNSPLNWNTYSVPSASSTVTIPAGRPHYPDNYTSDPVAATLILEAGSSMTLTQGDDLTVNNTLLLQGGTLQVTGTAGATPEIHLKGDLTKNAGTFNHGNGKIFFDGTLPQTISGSFNFYHAVINNAAGVQVTSAISIAGVLSVMTNSTLTTNNYVTIESGGSIMHGLNTPGGQTGSITGNVTVKRRGSSNGSIYNYFSSPVSGANANVFQQPYYYDPSMATDTSESGLRNGWIVAGGILQTGVGYIENGAGTVAFTGTAFSAPVSSPAQVTIKKNVGRLNGVAFNLVGNPFPSAIDAGKFIDENGPIGSGMIAGTIYFWDDDGTGGSGWDDAEDYAAWNGAGLVAGPNSGTVFNGNIASCQSFFVEKVADGSGYVEFDNSMRTTQNQAFFRMMPIERLWVNLVNSANDYNETLIAFKPDATDGTDPLYDAKKINGNDGIAFYSRDNGRNYAIQAFAPLSGDKTIPLGFKTSVAGNHVLSLKFIENMDESVVVLLEDKTLGIFRNLRLDSAYTFTSAAGTFDSRFYLHFNPAVEISSNAQDCEAETGEIVLHQQGIQQWNFVVKDTAGNVVQTGNNFSGTAFLAVPAGMYELTLSDSFGYAFIRSAEVTVLDKVTSDFGMKHRSQNPIIGSIIHFNDNSMGSDFNEWSFGDGETATNVDEPTHSYNSAGIFSVSLRAWNGDCESTSTKTIVIGGTPIGNNQGETAKNTGIADAQENTVTVYSDGGENLFVAFSSNTDAQATVHLHDITGKLLYASDITAKDVHRVSVTSLPQAIYFVRVITSEKTYTQKIALGAGH